MSGCEHFTVAAHKLAVRDARLRVRGLNGLPRQTTADLELVVSELIANSLLHAGLGPEARIDVTLQHDAERVSIVVDDHGGFSRPRHRAGGLGFRVLDALCDEWSLEDGRVSATIHVRGAAADRPRAVSGPRPGVRGRMAIRRHRPG